MLAKNDEAWEITRFKVLFAATMHFTFGQSYDRKKFKRP
jgi:hypothetical protein